MKYFILLLGFIFLFTSCENVKVKKDLSLLYSKPIDIPDKISMTYEGKDTVINEVFTAKLKLIVYVDSVGCTSCSINKMYMWEPHLEYAKQYNGQLKFYFIFYPTHKSIDILRRAMVLNPINYPMMIDLNGDFEKSNPHLPKNKAMHTFLLDENNKVILVGNPLHNKEIEKLFYKITQELLSK